MPSCAIKWCKSNADMKNPELTFHNFPANEIQRGKWIAVVRLESNELHWMPGKNSKICSLHFRREDIYVLDDGKRRRLKKTAVPICGKESSIPLKSIKIEVDIEEDTTSKWHLPLNGGTAETIETNDNMREYSSQLNKTEHNISSDTQETILKHTLDKPGCSSEEANRTTIGCPNCKCKFNFTSEMEDEVSLQTLKEQKPPYSINAPLSEIESIFDTARKQMLMKQLKSKTVLAKKRLFKIKNLQQQNRRLLKKNTKLKETIKNLKNNAGNSNLHTLLSGFPEDLLQRLQKKKLKKNG